MKKLFKIVFISVFIFAIFGIYSACQANTITEISMDIYVDSNGNAKITEIWNCNTNEGTEVYHPYYNLGNSKIQNLTVSENGTEYVYDGYIEMQSEGKLNKNEYMTILVKFPSNTFSTANSLNHNFNYYYNMSQS